MSLEERLKSNLSQVGPLSAAGVTGKRDYGGPAQEARPYAEARAGAAGLLSATEVSFGFARRLLEGERDLHLQMANDCQAVLDALPSRLPAEAEMALQRILSRKL